MELRINRVRINRVRINRSRPVVLNEMFACLQMFSVLAEHYSCVMINTEENVPHIDPVHNWKRTHGQSMILERLKISWSFVFHWWLIKLRYRFKACCLLKKFQKISPCEMQELILCEVGLNPCDIRLNIQKISEFFDVQFNLTLLGSCLTSHNVT